LIYQIQIKINKIGEDKNNKNSNLSKNKESLSNLQHLPKDQSEIRFLFFHQLQVKIFKKKKI